MEKVIVIGSPGSGKSTFSRKLKDITNLPLYHLDMIWHNIDGTTIGKDNLIKELNKIFETNRWIIDGNYNRTLDLRLKECDTCFLLDYPLDLCLEGARKRVGTKRDDLPWVEKELSKEFEQIIIDFPKEKLPRIYELLKDYYDKKDIIIFKSREDADKYLLELK